MKPLVGRQGSSELTNVLQPHSVLPISSLVRCRLLSDQGGLEGLKGSQEPLRAWRISSLPSLGFKDSKTKSVHRRVISMYMWGPGFYASGVPSSHSEDTLKAWGKDHPQGCCIKASKKPTGNDVCVLGGVGRKIWWERWNLPEEATLITLEWPR